MTSGGSDSPSLPRHVAIIMDGNGRWAKLRGLPRVEGHRMGVRAVRAVVECARELRISCLTLYAFSLENWGRPEPEVRTLMTLLQEFLVSELPLLLRHRIRLRVIGETSSLPFAVRQVLERTVSATAENTEKTLVLGLSYAARNEIVRAARRLAAEAAEGKHPPAVRADRRAGRTAPPEVAMLLQRIATAVVLIPLLVASILSSGGRPGGWPFLPLCGVP